MYAEQQYNERQRLLNHTIAIWNDYGSFWLQHVRKKKYRTRATEKPAE